jgi:uncharacterized protein (DUF488 family)
MTHKLNCDDQQVEQQIVHQDTTVTATPLEQTLQDVKLFTIGFTQKTAEGFFKLLINAGVRRIVDVRLNNNRTLAGFTRQAHLPYLLREIAGIEHEHRIDLAPDDAILSDWKLNKKAKEAGKKPITWAEYKTRFTRLIRKRKIETLVNPAELDYACLLCSEPTTENCHRRLVAEYLRRKWTDSVTTEIVHL